jgi:hypothetical protein
MRTKILLVTVAGLTFAGCSATTPTAAWTFDPLSAAPATQAAKVIDVFKSPTCGCCHEWEAYLRRSGYTIRSIPTEDMAAIKAEHDVPKTAWSCHTAVIDGYTVEGHVPIEAIEVLLAQRPAIDGIALPSMPPGSPGMPGEKTGPFEILTIDDGETSSFGTF